MVRKYNEVLYSAHVAMKNIGVRFWDKYEDDLFAFAKDRSKTDIVASIHASWDRFWRFPSWTDKRIDWALALYDHGDWPGLVQPAKEADTTIPASATNPKPKPASKQNASQQLKKVTPPSKPPKPKPKPNKQAQTAASKKPSKPHVKKKCSNCYLANNPDRCGHGMFGPCEDWRPETKHEDYWPTWDDMKRAEQEDYRSRYKEL